MTNKILNLDISKEPKLNPIIYGRVGDGGSQRVTLNTSKRDEQLDLTGYTITFEGVTSGGKTKVFDSDNVVVTSEGLKKGTFDYVFPNMAFAVKGKYERAYFSFIKDGIRDTSGEIEIIVLDNADIDAAEAETIITEYNKLVTELRKLQDQAIADMNQNFAATQAKISELEKQLSDTQSELQQALKDFENGNFWKKEESFNKEQSSANVIYQLIGKEKVRLTFRIDLNGKVAGSDVENASRASFRVGATLFNPSQFTADSYINYPNLYSLDGNVQRGSNSTQGNIAQMCFSTNIIEELKRLLGETFFIDQGATDLKTQIDVLKKRGFEVNYHVHGYGSYPLGNLINTAWWLDDKTYSIGRPGNGTNQIKDITTRLDSLNFPRAISSDGYVHFIAYGGPSDGITPSTITTDYVSLDFTIDLSVNEHIKSMIAQNHVENLATQAEAEAGASDSKSMSPLRSKQQIDKRVATDTEILAGTDKTKLVTPYSSKLFYDSQEINRSKFLSVRTKYCAHRGNNSTFPENSLEAFKSVTRHEFFECDVQVTKDGEWIVMHDTTVDRTTNGTGNVKDLTYDQIRALKIDAGSNINNLQDWQKVVPDLAEVCQCARYGKTIPIIEIKGGSGEVYSDAQLDKFMDTLHQFRMLPDGVIVISFDSNILARLRQRSNELEMMWVQNNIPSNGLEICKSNRIGIDISYSSSTLTKENITAFHKAGLMVGTWTTPEANHQKQEGLGVDIITTDSKSGFLRYGSLTLKNGFTGNTNNGLQNYNVVEEISPGQVRAYFNVLNGSNTSDTLVATLPDWAVPFTNSWQFCNIRTSSGSILATANVMGKTADGAGPGIWVGLNWDQRTTWAAGILHWSLY